MELSLDTGQLEGEEKRRFNRIKDRHRMLAKVYSSGETLVPRTLTGTTADISKGGIQFQTHHPLTVGDDLKVHVALRNPAKAITRNCRVVWVDETDPFNYQVGVKFAIEPDLDSLFWDQYIDSCAKFMPS